MVISVKVKPFTVIVDTVLPIDTILVVDMVVAVALPTVKD
jgi:hypothetical protein